MALVPLVETAAVVVQVLGDILRVAGKTQRTHIRAQT